MLGASRSAAVAIREANADQACPTGEPHVEPWAASAGQGLSHHPAVEMKPCGECGRIDVAHTRTSSQSGESAGEPLNRDVPHAGLHVDPAVGPKRDRRQTKHNIAHPAMEAYEPRDSR